MLQRLTCTMTVKPWCLFGCKPVHFDGFDYPFCVCTSPPPSPNPTHTHHCDRLKLRCSSAQCNFRQSQRCVCGVKSFGGGGRGGLVLLAQGLSIVSGTTAATPLSVATSQMQGWLWRRGRGSLGPVITAVPPFLLTTPL